ncbi:hypothetical protein CsatB_019405 [Cannabis sativa]
MVGVTGVLVPIIFYDGESETDMGDVFVYPDLDFKKLQTILCRKIRIPPHQFSVFMSSSESRKKIPVNGKVNFWVISRIKECIFVVVPKRSKREKGKNKNKSNQNLKNFRLLKRNDSIDYYYYYDEDEYFQDQSISGYTFPTDWNRIKYAYKAINYQHEQMRYMIPCEDCLRAQALGIEDEFHLCVNDEMTFGFRTSSGPIARPNQIKSSKTWDLWSWTVNPSLV